jgi:hypothetical protein
MAMGSPATLAGALPWRAHRRFGYDTREALVSKDLKVTDKRIFTPEGELKDEFRHLKEQAPAAAERPPERTEAAPTPDGDHGASREGPPERSDPRPSRHAGPPETEGAGPRLELPGSPPGFGAPSFYDLVAVLAEPVSLYLGDVPLPDGQSAENLEMARLHIDLLDVLRQKTAGNLSAQEASVLEDVLYRLRVRYVQKRG